MTHRQQEPPLFSKGQQLTRAGATRVDLRRWSYMGLALALLGLAGWVYLEQASVVASIGYEIRQLEDRRERLRRELTSLRGDVAVRGSLGRILALGEQMGYALPDATDPSAYVILEYIVPGQEAVPETVAAEQPTPFPREGGAVGWMRDVVRRLGQWLGMPLDPPVEPASAPALD